MNYNELVKGEIYRVAENNIRYAELIDDGYLPI